MNGRPIVRLRERIVALVLKSFYFASVVRGRIAEEMIDLIALMANCHPSASIFSGISRISNSNASTRLR